ncbi:glucokinase [Epsilonproteobacteria bacterium SCGC AD-308-E02]|mgnify:CR=1 FL=1|jgi:glucokinase|nr:glucokinase [Epsilonproteobacteria bacterium SCGC AD-308-O04]SMP87684.1 glucokinase [Epsilonproteobacteria bacterium SCGC AD-308-E02]
MTLGLDAGGTYLRYELRNQNKIIKASSVKSSEIGLSQYIENILSFEKNIKNICISFAGQVKDGVISSSPNIVVDRHNIKEYFELKYDVNFFIENDLNCAVLAEAKAHKSDNICALYIGTGLGLGVLSSSTLIEGANSVAAELGHIPYKETPFACGCGKSNCIELFASGTALKMWKSYYDVDESLTLKELKNSSNKNENKIYEEFEKALLYAAGTAITLFNPEFLVLGGGIMMSNSDLCDTVISKMQDYAMPIALQKLKIQNTKIQNASLEGAFLLKDYHA